MEVEMLRLADEDGVGFCVRDKYVKAWYFESPIEEKFIDPIRLSAIYFIIATNHRGAAMNAILMRKFHRTLTTLHGVDFTMIEPVEGSPIYSMYPNHFGEVEEDNEIPEVKIVIRPDAILFAGESFLIDSRMLLTQGIYMSHGVSRNLPFDPRVFAVGDGRGSDWELMLLHLVGVVLLLEGFSMTPQFMATLGWSLAKLKRKVS